MAHLVQQMAYVDAVPWHGLGHQLPAKQPIEIWQKEAGMDWQIEETPVRFMTDQEALLKVQSTNNTLKEMQNALWDEERIVAGREDRLEKELGPVYFQQCKVPASLGPVLLGLIGEKAEAFGTVKEKAYRDEFRLVKTDKGWFLPISPRPPCERAQRCV